MLAERMSGVFPWMIIFERLSQSGAEPDPL